MEDQFKYLAIRLLYRYQNSIPNLEADTRQISLTHEDYLDLLDLLKK